MYVFFDTETSGLPRDWNAPVTRLANWPRIVQLGWICCDEKGKKTSSSQYIIKPVGFHISREVAKVHGITMGRALAEGVDLKPVLSEFSDAIQAASVMVAHNMAFDENVVGAELLRAGMPNVLAKKQRCCTMTESTDYCRLPGKYGLKWPSLTELHEQLFGESFDDAHGAIADTAACMRCFFRLQELGVL